MAVGILNNLVISPKGPLAELTTSSTSVFEKHAWIIDKKE
jgi:hypothetical protein